MHDIGMGKWRKKPIVIDAVQLNEHNAQEVADWCDGKIEWHWFNGERHQVVVVPTLEGRMQAREGDFVIRGIHGEFYPCQKAIFFKFYEPA